MATVQARIVGDSFELGYRFQRYWDVSMANAFFFGELGAGLFFVSFFYNVVPGMILGLAVTGILKTYAHLAHMGVPMKSWRAILRPDRAWISRGLITIGFFITFGALHVLIEVNGLFGLVSSSGGTLAFAIKTIAAVAALGVMVYHGLAMSDSTAISLWSNRLMPFASVGYALVSGAALTTVLGWGALTSDMPDALPALPTLSLYLLVANTVVIVGLLYGAYHGSPGARVSVNLLLKGDFANRFVPLVLGVGLAIPLLLLLLAPETFWIMLLVAAVILTGFYMFRVFIFRAGVYEPIISFAPQNELGRDASSITSRGTAKLR